MFSSDNLQLIQNAWFFSVVGIMPPKWYHLPHPAVPARPPVTRGILPAAGAAQIRAQRETGGWCWWGW